MKTAAQALARWQAQAGAAAQAWNEGIQSSQKDQAALAAAAQPRYLAGVQDAVANNRFANGVTRRGTGYWKSQSTKKSANYSVGYTAGADNFSSAIGKVINAEANLVSALPPRGDINQNLQRSQQMALGLHALKGQLGAA